MNFLFRVDASIEIGTGHVMRCLTLADALRKKGAYCKFVCRAHIGNLSEQIEKNGFDVKLLPRDPGFHPYLSSNPTTYASWLGTEMITDAEQTATALQEIELVDWLIVDHYAIGAEWESLVRQQAQKLMVIDDLANRRHSCDLLLDQNLGRLVSDYELFVPATSSIFVGPSYALLRPQFKELRAQSLSRRSQTEVKTILVAMGGIDATDATGSVLQTLQMCALPGVEKVIVVMGQHSPHLNRVQALAYALSLRAEVHVNVFNMAQLMLEADLVIGAAGGMSWERCCLGVPSLLVILAENQRKIATQLATQGCAKLIGDLSDITTELPRLLDEIFCSDLLDRLSKNSRQIVDGRGIERVLNMIENSRV